MCYDAEARPPLPPIRGAALDSGDAILTSADGTRLRAHGARAQAPGGAGIVILPDVRGLHPFYEELALRFAEAGAQAVAIDYFARTAGIEPREAGFDYMPHLAKVSYETLSADAAAGAAYLRTPDGGGPERVYTVGFCFGGRLSYLQATQGLGLEGVIGFYGPPVGAGRGDLPAPIDEVDRFECKVLALWGGADQGIPPEKVGAFEAALEEAGVEHRSVIYRDAPHSFFDRHASDYADAAADAWRQMLDFMELPAG
jgi:carboxymethylenebutenolidase